MSMPVRAFVLAVLIAVAARADAAPPIKVMLLDGESGGPWHKWQLTTPVLKKQLDDTGLFQVDVVTAPPAGGDFSRVQAGLRRLPRRRLELRRARRALARGAEGRLRAVRDERRRRRHRPRRRQRVPRLARLQRDDRHRRLARPQREGGPALVHEGRQARRPTLARSRRQPRPARAVPGHDAERHAPDHARAAEDVDAPGRRALREPSRPGQEHDRARHRALASGQRRHRTRRAAADGAHVTARGASSTRRSATTSTRSAASASRRRSSAARSGRQPAASRRRFRRRFPTADTVAYRADLAAMDPDFDKGLNRLDPPPPPRQPAAATRSPARGRSPATWSATR